MRKLTIKRRKVYSGSLSKVRFYIEDPLAQEITINQVPCRKLGELKNGSEETYEIGNDAVRIFSISDKLSKNYSSECYQLPAGSEDVTLTGQCQTTPGGSFFQFDDNNSAGVASKRKRNTTIGLIILVVAVLLGTLGGRYFSGSLMKSSRAADKEFSSHGMNITLTKSFSEDSALDFTACFSSKDVMVLAQKESFSLATELENATLDEYAEMALEVNDRSLSELKDYNGIPGFEYDYSDADSGDTYHYRVYLYKSSDAFWMIHFVTFQESFAGYEAQIDKWAHSVSFAS